MKSFVLLLLVATSIQAQILSDVARQERERQARIQSSRTFTSESAKAALPQQPLAPSAPIPAAGPNSVAAPNAAPNAPAGSNAVAPRSPAASAPQANGSPSAQAPPAANAPAKAAEEALKKWNEEVTRIRTRLQQLQDQEVRLQLQVNQFTNQFFAPVTDEASRSRAQTQMGETQNRLSAVRTELEQTRTRLQQMEAQGPPRP